METSSSPLFSFRFIWGKISFIEAQIQYIWIALNLAYIKNKLYKSLDYCSRDMFNFGFLEKEVGIVSPQHFA